MILGNKCDMEEKRVVSKERGEAVSETLLYTFGLLLPLYIWYPMNCPLQFLRKYQALSSLKYFYFSS